MARFLRGGRRTLVGLVGAAVLLALAGGSRAGAATELVPDGGFAAGSAGWAATGVASGPTLVDGALCVDVPDGVANPWDAVLYFAAFPLVAAEGYGLSLRARASRPVVVTTLVQHLSGGFEPAVSGNPALSTEWQTFSSTGASPVAVPDGGVVVQLGGKGAFTFCLDDVSVLSGVEPPKYQPNTGPRVRVNQVGYLPAGPKIANLVTDATAALPWQLHDASGAVVRTGTSKPAGVDRTSGQNVHTIDFSAYARAGTGYTLSADGQTSYPFAISAAPYRQLRRDSMTFYYTQRSGLPILDSVAPGYARKAGHLGVAPNQGDAAVSCQRPVDFLNNWTCDPSFTRDVTGGWYDAGDHGKYVVNGGIAVAQLLGSYERALRTGGAAALGDSTLRVPETGNKVPDILDEARWELDWMLKMQVPPGSADPGIAPYAGMAFHKVQDSAWTGLPLAPAADPEPRELHRPSTAATLNLAAAAAQGARLYCGYDRAFSARLLKAAKTAYAAAKRVPDLYAPDADGNSGGGAYGDSNVSDEFYWAAAELYLTTGERSYLHDLTASPLQTADVFNPEGFYWGSTAALARLDLATVPSRLPGLGAVRSSVLAGADRIVALQGTLPYGQPYAPESGQWSWGSNSQILNNLVVLGTAYDLSRAPRYRAGVLTGTDYLLGRNALNNSYITGYGTYFSQNQHTRMYAHELDPSLPHPPAGSLAGGANTSIQDPVAQAKLAGCVGQFCYLDDIGSYATNEIAINWNAPLVWVAAFVAGL